MWKISDDNRKTLRIPNTAPPPPQKKRPGKAYDEEALYSNGVFTKTLFFKARHYIAILKPSNLWIIFNATSFVTGYHVTYRSVMGKTRVLLSPSRLIC